MLFYQMSLERFVMPFWDNPQVLVKHLLFVVRWKIGSKYIFSLNSIHFVWWFGLRQKNTEICKLVKWMNTRQVVAHTAAPVRVCANSINFTSPFLVTSVFCVPVFVRKMTKIIFFISLGLNIILELDIF